MYISINSVILTQNMFFLSKPAVLEPVPELNWTESIQQVQSLVDCSGQVVLGGTGNQH